MASCEVIVIELDGTKRFFPSVAETGRYYHLTETAVRNRIKGIVQSEPRKFRYAQERNLGDPFKTEGSEVRESSEPAVPEISELTYETSGTRICITPCPHRPQYKIGSAGCQDCCKFKGIDREHHIVKCTHKGVNERKKIW